MTHFGAQAYAMFDADGSGSMTRMEIVEVQYDYDYISSLSSGWKDRLGHIRGPGKIYRTEEGRLDMGQVGQK